MKTTTKVILTVIATIMSATSATAGEVSDTVAVVDSPISVAITSYSDGKKVIVWGTESDPDYYLEYESRINENSSTDHENSWFLNPIFQKSKHKSEGRMQNPTVNYGCDIYAGAVIPMNGDRGMDRTGWELGMLNVAKVNWRLSRCGTALSIGLGWQYRHITVGDGMMLGKSDNNSLVLLPIASGYADCKSSLKSFSLQVPVLLRQKIYRSFSFEAGAIGMINSYTTASSSWREGNVTSKMAMKNLHQRIFTVDAIARIGWSGDFSVYVRYSPAQFKSQFGPKYESIAVGASIGF